MMAPHDDDVPAHAQMVQMAGSLLISRVVYAAAKLGLAELLEHGPRSAGELAPITGTKERTLYRLMRTLSALGVLSEVEAKCFALTPLGETLKRDHPGRAWAATMMIAGESGWRAWDHFMHSLETGEAGFQKAHGKNIFSYLSENPEEAEIFSHAMIGFHGEEPAAVAKAYDFSRFKTVIDIGGATGHSLTTILEHHQEPHGVVFDLPHVVRGAVDTIARKGMENRVRTHGGSFFEAVPGGGDAYILSHIIHDWNEEQCLTILGNCRQSMNPDGRVLIVEMVLPEGNTPHPGKLLDMIMLTVPGGEERTASEYRELLGMAGFQLEEVVPTESTVSIVVAAPA